VNFISYRAPFASQFYMWKTKFLYFIVTKLLRRWPGNFINFIIPPSLWPWDRLRL